ncbi:MAG: hypothetical protein ACI8QZ_000908, partial [Chlamydiales bacterium]
MMAKDPIARPLTRIPSAMKSRSSTTAALLLLLAGSTWSAPQNSSASPSASRQELLTARAVIDRYLDLTGEGKILASTRSTRTKGRLEIVDTEIAGPMEVLAHSSNKRLVQVELAGVGSVREGFDGTTAWAIEPGAGASLQEGLEHLQASMHANYTGPLKEADEFERVQTVARTEFDGKSCWKIEIVAKLPAAMDAQETQAVRTSHEYYDVDTGLLIGREMTTPTGMKVVVVSS